MDLQSDSPRAGCPPPLARRFARRGPDRSPEPGTDPDAVDRGGSPHRGRCGRGGLSVGTVLEERRWPHELLPRLQLLADIFANVLARQRAARAAHESAKDI